MKRNIKVIAAVGLIPEPRALRAICRGRAFLTDIKGIGLSVSHLVSDATLEVEGLITID